LVGLGFDVSGLGLALCGYVKIATGGKLTDV